MDRPELLELIAGDPGLDRLHAHARDRLGDDPGHDVAHCLRVALWTVRLGGDEVDVREAVAAALLHDIVNLPKDSPQRAKASELSANEAAELLPHAGFAPPAVARVCAAILDHSYSRGAVPTTPLGRALQDADRLEALGVLGVFRTISCGARMGALYFDPDDPWAVHRPLQDHRFSIDHFFTKLLRLSDTMHTEAGRAEAHRRTAFMQSLLEQLGHEIGVPPGQAHDRADRPDPA